MEIVTLNSLFNFFTDKVPFKKVTRSLKPTNPNLDDVILLFFLIPLLRNTISKQLFFIPMLMLILLGWLCLEILFKHS